jgi:hypothetical protein
VRIDPEFKERNAAIKRLEEEIDSFENEMFESDSRQ